MKRILSVFLIVLLLSACTQLPQNETAQATAQAHAPESDMTQADTPTRSGSWRSDAGRAVCRDRERAERK
jgi:Prokaryotic membrane lipoprotein lipid attachment site.